MAKKNSEEKLNYAQEIRELKANGPKRLYLLWGPEDYLRQQYLAQLKKLCLPDGEDAFSFKRIDGPLPDLDTLRDAIDAMPFMTERTFVELRGVDFGKLENPESYISVLSDIPDYCTVAFVQSAQYEPDGRLKIIKALRGICKEIKFTQQSQGMLTDWIVRRFAAAGKSVELEAAQRLIFISGDLMNRLIPEIDKISAYTSGDRVTVKDVEAVASHIPEADVFEMTEFISQKKYNAAASVLAELLSNKNNEPIAILALLGLQMRKLYIARLAVDKKLGVKFVMETAGVKYEYHANKLITAARGYTFGQLIRAVELCAEADYRMKSSGIDSASLLKETVMRIAMGEESA